MHVSYLEERIFECLSYLRFELSNFRVISCSSFPMFELSNVRVI